MNRKVGLLLLASILFAMNIDAQERVKLWQDSSPKYENNLTGEEQVDESGRISNVSSPELYIYKPKTGGNGKTVLICPGGGYTRLAFGHEGWQMAKWFVEKGFTAIVLKYRMPNKVYQVPIEDGQQAMRYIRENATELGITTNKIGIVGFSAGGHLAATISNHYAMDGISTRPDFTILFYPVITMGEKAHRGSRSNLFGDKPSASNIDELSLEKQVTANTPPTILFLSDDDKSVPSVNSTMYYNALKDNGVPSAMYVFSSGGHGWGFRKDFEYHNEMVLLLEKWIDDLVPTESIF